MTAGFFELAIVVGLAALLGFIARLLKQPVILAYLFTGIIVGVFEVFRIGDRELFQTFSELGIMFLLFLIGLEINYSSLRLVGRTSVIVGIAQLVFTFVIGFLISLIFHFSYLEATYISIALTFSSTIIVVKLLSEKKDLDSLYGKIAVGFLLIQDFFAILILVFLSGIEVGDGHSALRNIIFAVFKGIIIFGLMFYLGRKILPMVFDKIAKSQELLFIASLAWCLGVAAAVSKAGFSIEIGGFLAGITLANSSEHYQIAARIKSLRDFFVLIFFVILGSSLLFTTLLQIIWPVIIFSLFVLVGNPLIVIAIMGFMGYRKRTGFLCGITVAQISEFSLILAAMGLKLGHISAVDSSLITAVGIITFTVSSYLIIYNEEIFRYLSRFLNIFERRLKKEEEVVGSEFMKPIILVGSHRVGQNIAANLPKDKLLIIDFDPEVTSELRRLGYTTLFGDIADTDIQEKAHLKNAKLVISTSPDFEDNMRLLSEIKTIENKSQRPKTIFRAENERDAEIFYENGADYVLLPHFTSGQYLGRSIAVDQDLKILNQLRKNDLEQMKSFNRKRVSKN